MNQNEFTIGADKLGSNLKMIKTKLHLWIDGLKTKRSTSPLYKGEGEQENLFQLAE